VPRLTLAYYGFMFSAILRGQGVYALKGLIVSVILLPKKLVQRGKIQRNRKVGLDYIESIISYDLPPNARDLRALRDKWWKLTGKLE
jgi:hypothetical protein